MAIKLVFCSSAAMNIEVRQVYHEPEAGANVLRSLADGRMDVEGHLGRPRAWTGCCSYCRLAWPNRTARPSTVHDALCRAARRCQYRLFIPLYSRRCPSVGLSRMLLAVAKTVVYCSCPYNEIQSVLLFKLYKLQWAYIEQGFGLITFDMMCPSVFQVEPVGKLQDFRDVSLC